MANRHHERADQVVAAFKDLIGEEARKQIQDVHFQDLTLLVRDAISEELREAAELVEKVARQIRSETDIHEMDL